MNEGAANFGAEKKFQKGTQTIRKKQGKKMAERGGKEENFIVADLDKIITNQCN